MTVGKSGANRDWLIVAVLQSTACNVTKYDLGKFGFTNTVVNTWNSLPNLVVSSLLILLTRSKQDSINSGIIRILSIISGHCCKEPEVVASFRTKTLSKE